MRCCPPARSTSRASASRRKKLQLAKPDAIVMHPGPINRGVEIDSAVVDGKQSVILPQVTFGIAVRMAVMSIVAGNEAQRNPCAASRHPQGDAPLARKPVPRGTGVVGCMQACVVECSCYLFDSCLRLSSKRWRPIWLEIMKILIQNGRVIDPASGLDQICDVAVAAGRIVAWAAPRQTLPHSHH